MLKCNNCPNSPRRHGGPNFSASAFFTRMDAVWFGGKISDAQVGCLAGFAAVYAVYNGALRTTYRIPVSCLAYVLATTYHETAFTMQPIEEYGKGAGHPYGEPDPETGLAYYGRGYVQLIWKDNYQKVQDSVVDLNTLAYDVPLVMQPDLVLKT
ncbi:hypothetical protein [Enterobacter mori]|uniref:hypothetical protein n=1 Tax=Enterobacter mori TaxID=539813 RepID=UPI002ED28A3D|nr:hypothetical protein [Enterobacter mori]